MSWLARGKVGWPKHVSRTADVGYHVLLEVDLIAAGEHVDAQFVKVDGVVSADTEPACRPIGVCDHEFGVELASQLAQQRLDAEDTCLGDDFANEKDTHR